MKSNEENGGMQSEDPVKVDEIAIIKGTGEPQSTAD